VGLAKLTVPARTDCPDSPPQHLPELFGRRRVNCPGGNFVVRTAEGRADVSVARTSTGQHPAGRPGADGGLHSAGIDLVLHPATPRAARPGRLCIRMKEVVMFEGQPQNEIDALMKADPEFKQLYQQHRKLDKKCTDAGLGVRPIDATAPAQTTREKLRAQKKLVRIYASTSNRTSPTLRLLAGAGDLPRVVVARA